MYQKKKKNQKFFLRSIVSLELGLGTFQLVPCSPFSGSLGHTLGKYGRQWEGKVRKLGGNILWHWFVMGPRLFVSQLCDFGHVS